MQNNHCPSSLLRSVVTILSSWMFALLLAGSASVSTGAETKSALEADPQGWQDILPGDALKGWYRVTVPPNGTLGREQWHVDADRKVLVCDGDGGHDMLLTSAEYDDAIFHFEFCYTKIEGKTGYNSGAYVRNSKDGALWHQAQFGDAKDGFLFGETMVDGSKKFFNTQKDVKENRVKPAGEWNTMEVTARGRVLSLWVNGAVTAKYEACGVPSGHVGLEGEGYRIEFRNLKIKRLSTPVFSKGTIDMGIVVSDLEKSARFYTEALGMTEVQGFSVTADVAKKIGLIDNMPATVRMFVAADGDASTRIKMMSFPTAGGKIPNQSFIHSTLGFRYLTLYVNSADKALERLAKYGVKTIGETPLSMGANRLIAFQDPDGNFIELIGP